MVPPPTSPNLSRLFSPSPPAPLPLLHPHKPRAHSHPSPAARRCLLTAMAPSLRWPTMTALRQLPRSGSSTPPAHSRDPARSKAIGLSSCRHHPRLLTCARHKGGLRSGAATALAEALRAAHVTCKSPGSGPRHATAAPGGGARAVGRAKDDAGSFSGREVQSRELS